MKRYRHVIIFPAFLLIMFLSRHTVAEAGAVPLSVDDKVIHLSEMQVLAEVKADEVYQLKESGKIIPLEELINRVRKDYPGRIIEIDLDDDDGHYVYELELVDDQGIAHELEVDARSGQVLKYEQDD